MKRKRLGGLAVALALGLGVTSVVPAPVAAAAVEAGWSDEMSTGEVVQGDEWTQEIVTNFYSGEMQKVIMIMHIRRISLKANGFIQQMTSAGDVIIVMLRMQCRIRWTPEHTW